MQIGWEKGSEEFLITDYIVEYALLMLHYGNWMFDDEGMSVGHVDMISIKF